MGTPIVDIQALTFDYPGFRALERLGLQIEAGSVTALVGPNGAGKTTLLRCIAALDTPVSGSVRVAGIDVHETPRDAHQLMGYVSDNFGLYGDLTVAQGLEFAARAKGIAIDRVPGLVRSTAARMGLMEKLDQPAKTLSRGQRQRVAIGQAIIHAPRLLLLDEPASGLDPEARASLADVFKALQAEGMTLLVSSHILAELDAYSTHMLSIHDGQVLEHRALGQATAPNAVPERLLRLEFVAQSAAALAWLVTQPHVVRADADGASAVQIAFSGDAADQSALVAACVGAGWPLLALAQITENLQHSYLKSLQAKRREAA